MDDTTDPVADDEFLRTRFAQLNREELHQMVTTDREDYLPRALELAEAELLRRPTDEGVEGPSAAPDEGGSALQWSAPPWFWMDVYATLLGAGAISLPVLAVLGGRSTPAIVFDAVVCSLLFSVAIGLRRRRFWAWRANWIVLIVISLFRFVVYVEPVQPGLICLWAGLWASYFLRHKSHFFPPKQEVADVAREAKPQDDGGILQ